METYTVNRHAGDVVSNQAPPLFEISIREHKMPPNIFGPICMWQRDQDGCGFEGKIATVKSAWNRVFGYSDARTIIHCKLPEGYYGFRLKAPAGNSNALQNQFITAVRTTFGLEAKQSVRKMDVYVMTQISNNVTGLRAAQSRGGGGQAPGGFQLHGSEMKGVAEFLEIALDRPVIDETGMTGIYDVDMKWKPTPAGHPANPDAVVVAARERLGLQLTPARRPIQVLEVDQPK